MAERECAAVRLELDLEPAALRRDYLAIADRQAVAAGYPGERHVHWTSVCVYSEPGGRTAAATEAPYLIEVLERLGGAAVLARVMILRSGGTIREHRDGFLSGERVRLHVPIVTHDRVEFFLDGERCRWREGELWYGDFSRPHGGENKSPIDRAHLVIDAYVNRRLLDLFPRGRRPSSLRVHEPTPASRGVDLRAFVVDFELPRGLELPGTGFAPLPASVPAGIHLVRGELVLHVQGEPMLGARPSSSTTLELVGLEGASLELRRAAHRAVAVELVLAGRSRLALPMLRS